MQKVIKQIGNMRLIEVDDTDYDMDNLKGDCFTPKHNPGIDPAELAQQEKDFEQQVYNDGVYGYIVERWNPATDAGWEHVDSIWGFVGNSFFGSGYDTDLMSQLESEAVS